MEKESESAQKGMPPKRSRPGVQGGALPTAEEDHKKEVLFRKLLNVSRA